MSATPTFLSASLRQGVRLGKSVIAWGVRRRWLGLASILKHLCLYRWACWGILAALLVQTAFRVSLPLVYELLFDRAIGQGDRGLLGLLLLALLGALVVNSVAGVAQDLTTSRLAAWVMRDLRRAMFLRLQTLRMETLERLRSGAMMSRFSNDLAGVETAITRGLVTVVLSSLVLAASVVLLFTVDWRLAVWTFAALAVALVGPRLLGPRAVGANYERKQSEAEVTARLHEDLRAAIVVRAYGLEDERRRGFSVRLDNLARRTVQSHFSAALVGRTATSGVFAVQLLILGIGGFLATGGDLTLGALASFVALLLNIANASSHIAGVVPDLAQAAGGFRRVEELLGQPPTPSESEAPRSPCRQQDLPRLRHELVVDRVSFVYRNSEMSDAGEAPGLHGLSFRLSAGQSLGVVGPSGSGKSTLVKLLAGLYTPDRGRIFLDGHDMGPGSEASPRRQIALVPQEPVLFDATVRDNIRLGDLAASDQEVEDAARKAGIHGRILALPQGYDTRIGEGGGGLSGGEQQRIAIARALVRRPALLILDEATSALDPITEAGILATLDEIRESTTVISVTHRLAAAERMDRILVLDRGQRVEMGPHHDLVQQGGVYSSLWRQQTVSEDMDRSNSELLIGSFGGR